MAKMNDSNGQWKNRDRKRRNGRTLQRIMGMLFLCVLLTACERQEDRNAQADTGTGAEGEAEAGTGTGTGMGMKAADGTDTGVGTGTETMGVPTDGTEVHGKEQEKERAGVITVYTSTEPEYSDEEIPAVYVDDLSLLSHMEQADHSYAYKDGKVYYRRYHEDSYEEGALWGNYSPMLGTDKEIVCIDADGENTVLFSDKGYGDIYLIGERFYMTEKGEKGSSMLYSVDMQGQERIDYGDGMIGGFDRERNILILDMRKDEQSQSNYFVLDCMKNEMIPLNMDFYHSYDSLYLEAYHDGWCYFDVHKEQWDDICRVIAVSLEGEQREIIALAPDKTTYDCGYRVHICEMGVVGDRIYIIYGGYAGSACVYQGGRIITVKLDGSDYRAIESYSDIIYVCHDDAGRPLVYLPRTYDTNDGKEYETTVWDVEAHTLFPSDFPEAFFMQKQVQDELTHQEGSLCVWNRQEGVDVYALPDGFGTIVPVVTHMEDGIIPRGDGETYDIRYKHPFYADGFLYFDVEYNIYDREYAIGWRDGYRRGQTDVYRLKLDGNVMELLYSY